MTDSQYHISWTSPSNIALIKYWGKHGRQLPNNASLSMTLSNALTTTKMAWKKSSSGLMIDYFFEGQKNIQFEEKVKKFLQSLIPEMPFLAESSLHFDSTNSFPHSTGIASSASSMSALALCLVSLEEHFSNIKLSQPNFYRRASYIARLGSGSASRSVFGGWVSWGETVHIENSSNEYASPISFPVYPLFQDMGDAVLIVSSEKKQVSSTLGHKQMDSHPYSAARYKQADNNLKKLIDAMVSGDFSKFAEIVEEEALSLHGLLMTSSNEGLLMKPNTLKIIEAIREFRTTTNAPICFTLDAGPNVHVLYPISVQAIVHRLIQDNLVRYCENEKWIDDKMGGGPNTYD